jgi:hypothetical protein
MSEPTEVDIVEARPLIIALARCTTDESLEGASALLDAIDHREGSMIAAKLISELCCDIAVHQGRSGQAVLDGITVATIEAAANPADG